MYNIEFSEKDLEILDEALTNLPYKKVFELIEKINQQINEQDNNELEI